MPRESSTLEEKIARLGLGHLISEAIIIEYIQSPTLVYITFWDEESLPACRPSTSPLHRYGIDLLNADLRLGDLHRPSRDIRCIVENYKSAFSPLLASKYMRHLYEKLRPSAAPSRRPNVYDMKIFPKDEIREDGVRPIDYHFLENFHRTNVRGAPASRIMIDDSPCAHYNNKWKGWGTNIIVRMSELWDVIKDWDITPNATHDERRTQYGELFGILACGMLPVLPQEYLILINRKEEDKQTRERYDALKTDNAEYNKRLLDDMKSYDVAGKVFSDLTFASLDDFDEEQRVWAAKIECCFATFDKTWLVPPINAYYVRWKTEEELKEERKPTDQSKRGRSGLGGRDKLAERKHELLHQSPVNLTFASLQSSVCHDH
ncbi:hypothetical protein F5Y03DRAFT_407507 [Xylaria venustula]|nr:hypothetical protein F5Y03DRAFT_407507 [Xylaria venustula]